MSSSDRPKNLGILMVVGGPGGSGASTIAMMLASHFKLNRIYAGGLMRDIAKSKGFESFEAFLENIPESELEKLDKSMDKKLMKYSFLPNILIDSKVFAAFSSKYRISTTVKIWLDCNLEIRVKRKLGKVGGSYDLVLEDLKKRYEHDKARFERLYGIDYSSPKKYNDIVLDTSKINEYQTFSLILKLIEDGKYIRK